MTIEEGEKTKFTVIGFMLICFYSQMLVHPVEAAEITSPFGWRIHPITGEWAFHAGLDLAYDYGTPIAAVIPGTVIFAEPYGGYGNTVIVRHADNQYTLYAHCSELYAVVGQVVDQSIAIAAVGSSGNSTGPHLHIELWENGEYADPIKLWN